MVNLCQSDALMVDETVFEQTPKLQAAKQEAVICCVDMAKPAVETVDRPQLSALHQHCKLHLLHMSHIIRAEPGVKIRT